MTTSTNGMTENTIVCIISLSSWIGFAAIKGNIIVIIT